MEVKDGDRYPNGWGDLTYHTEDHLNREKYKGNVGLTIYDTVISSEAGYTVFEPGFFSRGFEAVLMVFFAKSVAHFINDVLKKL